MIGGKQTEKGRYARTSYPFVVLSAANDLHGHKRPVEEAWQTKAYTLAEAAKRIRQGYGIGLDIARTATLAVIDIDNDGQGPDLFHGLAAHFGQQGAVVCWTPSGGLHIIFRRPEPPPPDGRYLLKAAGYRTPCEWYAGGGHRQIVLPIAGTPRVRLGGRLFWAKGEIVKTPQVIKLEELPELLTGLPSVVGYELRPPEEGEIRVLAPQVLRAGTPAGLEWVDELAAQVSVADSTEDPEMRAPSKKRLLEEIARAPKGLRHTTALAKAIELWEWGYDLDGIPEALAEAHKEDGAAERRRALKEGQDIVAWVQQKRQKGIRAARAAKPRKSPKKVTDKVAQALQEGGITGWIEYRSKTYVVVDGRWAYTRDGLQGFLAGKGIHIGRPTMDTLIGQVREKLPLLNLHMVRHYPTWHNGRALVSVWVDGTRGILCADAEGLRLVEDPAALGVVVDMEGRRRIVPRAALEHPEACRDYLVQLIASYFEGDLRQVAKVLAVVSPLAQGLLLIVGPSGSGKSALRALLQFAVNGEELSVDARKVENFLSAAANSGLVGIEEVSFLSDEIYNIINQATTSGGAVVRQLYTTDEIARIPIRSSIVIATTDLRNLRADTARRGIEVYPRVSKERAIGDAELYAAFAAEQGIYLVGLMQACVGFRAGHKTSAAALTGIQIDETTRAALEGEGLPTSAPQDDDLPEQLRKSAKNDIARAYWHHVKWMGLLEEAALSAWVEGRENIARTGLPDEWKLLMELLMDEETGPIMRTHLAKGMTATEIAELIGVPAEGVDSFAQKLGRDHGKAYPLLEELGYPILKERKRWNRTMTNVYTLVNQLPLTPSTHEDEPLPF